MSDPNVTYPQTFLPSRLAAGEDYATVDQILQCGDRRHATLHIPYWRINGNPVAIRVQSLSLQERDLVQRETDTVAQYCLIWQLGCVCPTFTEAQANQLSEKNPHAVEGGASFIMTLSALNQEWIDHVVTAQTNAPAATPSTDAGAAADPSHRPRARRVDRPAGPKVRPAARRAAENA